MPTPAGCTGAMMLCPMGSGPMTLNPLPIPRVMIAGRPAAQITTNIPFVNIPPFVTCTILTAAALGVPVPCTPATVAPWTPTSPTVLVGGVPVQTQPGMLMCAIGGPITTIVPGQFTVMA